MKIFTKRLYSDKIANDINKSMKTERINMIVYLDNSSTTKPSKEVVEIMLKVLNEQYGNPSSLHHMGVEVEKLMKGARRQVSKALRANEKEITFTAGGTEANNIAILGSIEANKRKGNTIITTKIEHPSVINVYKYLETKGFNVVYLDVDIYGRLNIDQLKANISNSTILISVMHVNNEIGTIQPVKEIGNILKKEKLNIAFHMDAVQSFGKVPFSPSNLGTDLVSISGHKIHGPKGVGVLFKRKEMKISPIVFGGNQEEGIRSGTENIPGILGIGVAAEHIYLNSDENIKAIESLKAKFIGLVKSEISDIKINSPEIEDSAPHIVNISFLGTRGEVLLHLLEQDNIYVSTGSACSSKKDSKSHVLKAIGLKDEEIQGAIRFSFSEYNTLDEIYYVVEKLKNHVKDLRKIIKR